MNIEVVEIDDITNTSPQVISLDTPKHKNENEVISLGTSNETKSAHFGPGIEMLMNDKKKEKSAGSSKDTKIGRAHV